jgi:hypothetical protein
MADFLTITNASELQRLVDLAIPPSNTAHQALDKKYYRRFNFAAEPMHDYEIRDVMKRSSTAEPFIRLSFDMGNNSTSTRIAAEAERVTPVPLIVSVGNRSPEPAYYTLLTIGVDAQLEIDDFGRFDRGEPTVTSQSHRLNQVQKRISVPEFLPIFQEASFPIGDRPLCFSFDFRTASDEYLIRCTVQTPGFSNAEDWIIHRSGTRLTLEGPLAPIHAL